MQNEIYLDNSMTCQPSQQAVAAMMPFLTERWGNPSAPHQHGQDLFPAIEENLRALYSLLNADDKDYILLTSSGAEAVNHAIFTTYVDVARTTGKNQFITSHIDEAPTLMSIGRLEQMGCTAKLVSPTEHGLVTPEAIAEAMTPRTVMVSLSWANGLTGVIHPIAQIAKLCRERGVRLHVDATHILGKLHVDLRDLDIDFVSFNGSHLHAVPGTGGLYIRHTVKPSAFILGGLEQGGLRAGALNMPGLAALGKAAQETLSAQNYLCTEVARLRDRLEQGIVHAYSDAVPLFTDQERLPHCTTIAFKGIFNEAMLYSLHRKKVFGSIGGGAFQKISLLLIASTVAPQLANSAINFSLSRYTSEEEIDRAINIIGETANQLRKLSAEIV